MSSRKEISLIIPHFNDAFNLSKLLESIKDFSEIEVLVIDDGSCEEQFKKLVLLEGEYKIKVLKNTHKKGAGGARNTGIVNSTGAWLLFADSDDLFVNNFPSKVISYCNSRSDIVYFSPASHSDNNSISKRHIPYDSLVKSFLENDKNDIRYRYTVPWSKLIKRALVDKYEIRFDECIASNDVMFSLKCGYYANVIDASKSVFYSVFDRPGSLTKIKSKKVVRSRFLAMMRYNRFIEDNSIDISYQSSLISTIYMYCFKYNLVDPVRVISGFFSKKWRKF